MRLPGQMENTRDAQKEFGPSYLNTINLLEDQVLCGKYY